MNFKSLSLRVRFILSIAGILLVSMVALSIVTIMDARRTAVNSAVTNLTLETRGNVIKISAIINHAFAVTSEFRNMMESAIESGTANRSFLNMRFERSLSENERFFGTWVVMEPNMLDGRDSMMQPGDGNDMNGVYTPYYVRDGSDIVQDTNDPEYDVRDEFGEDYYKIAHDTKDYVLTEPYTETLNDKSQIVMTSTAAPVLRNGDSVGVTGIDFDLTEIQDALSQIKPFETGFAMLLTGDQMIIAHPDNSLLGKSIEDADYSADTLAFLKSDDAKSQLVSTNGENYYAFTQPVTFSHGAAIWHLVVFAPESGILEQVSSTTNSLILTGAILILISLAVAWFIAARQVSPIIDMSSSMEQIADGNLTADIPDHPAKTELGMMATALASFKEKAQENQRLQDEAEKMRLESEQQRKQAMQEAADRFEQEVQTSFDTARGSVQQISSRTSDVQKTSADTLDDNELAARETDQVSMNVSTVSASVEELTASIREISSQTQTSQNEAVAAADQARETHSRMTSLVDAVAKINEIGSLIQDIAEQTNLLALNATIEAARAGEAGKGFAVVAGEVKNLANQTAQATEQISKEVAEVQDQTRTTAGDIEQITKMVEKFSQLATAVAAAVEQQSAATSEISQAVSEAAQGTSRLREVVNKSRESAQESGNAATVANDSVTSLTREFENLTRVAEQFVGSIRNS